METWQMVKEITENPNMKFRSDSRGCYFVCAVDKNGFFKFQRYTLDGGLLSETSGQGIVSGNISIYDEWELIQEPVTFMEAVKAYAEGKTIRCKYADYVLTYNPNKGKAGMMSDQYGDGLNEQQILECEWYIDK